MLRALRLALVAILFWPLAATAQSLIVEKKTFAMPAYTTVGGKTIKDVKIG